MERCSVKLGPAIRVANDVEHLRSLSVQQGKLERAVDTLLGYVPLLRANNVLASNEYVRLVGACVMQTTLQYDAIASSALLRKCQDLIGLCLAHPAFHPDTRAKFTALEQTLHSLSGSSSGDDGSSNVAAAGRLPHDESLHDSSLGSDTSLAPHTVEAVDHRHQHGDGGDCDGGDRGDGDRGGEGCTTVDSHAASTSGSSNTANQQHAHAAGTNNNSSSGSSGSSSRTVAETATTWGNPAWGLSQSAASLQSSQRSLDTSSGADDSDAVCIAGTAAHSRSTSDHSTATTTTTNGSSGVGGGDDGLQRRQRRKKRDLRPQRAAPQAPTRDADDTATPVHAAATGSGWRGPGDSDVAGPNHGCSDGAGEGEGEGDGDGDDTAAALGFDKNRCIEGSNADPTSDFDGKTLDRKLPFSSLSCVSVCLCVCVCVCVSLSASALLQPTYCLLADATVQEFAYGSSRCGCTNTTRCLPDSTLPR